MNNNIDLEQITDIKELKAMKSDQYDILEVSQERARIAHSNIQNISARIAQLQLPDSTQVAQTEDVQ